jgi:hypothetical protein
MGSFLLFFHFGLALKTSRIPPIVRMAFIEEDG